MAREGRAAAFTDEGSALLAAMGLAFATAAPALPEPPENSTQGLIAEVSNSAEVVLVEENPSDRSGSVKGEFAVTGGRRSWSSEAGTRLQIPLRPCGLDSGGDCLRRIGR